MCGFTSNKKVHEIIRLCLYIAGVDIQDSEKGGSTLEFIIISPVDLVESLIG